MCSDRFNFQLPRISTPKFKKKKTRRCFQALIYSVEFFFFFFKLVWPKFLLFISEKKINIRLELWLKTPPEIWINIEKWYCAENYVFLAVCVSNSSMIKRFFPPLYLLMKEIYWRNNFIIIIIILLVFCYSFEIKGTKMIVNWKILKWLKIL